MKLTWLGHSCFILESLGYRIIIDPYRDVKGMADIEASVNGVYCSHGHFDHSYTDRIRKVYKAENPFKISEIHAYHDSEHGRLRGKNTIRRFESHGVSLVHLGDLGHQLDTAQKIAIGKVDVLLVPIGGTYTLDAQGAKQVVEELRPQVVIPMHYRQGGKGFPELGTLPEFTSLFPGKLVKHYEESSINLLPDMEQQIAVLKMP